MEQRNPPALVRLSDGLGPLRESCAECQTPNSCGGSLCLEAYISRRIRQELMAVRDCRTCRNFTTASGGCVSVLRCIDGSSYMQTRPMQFWEAAPLDPAPF